MALSTKNIKLSEGKTSKTITPGNMRGKIYDISLKPGYNQGSYYLVLSIEGEPLENFEGFFINPQDESQGRHQGQVGRVRYSQYAFETKTLPSGVKVDRDENILKALFTLAKAQGLSDAINDIEGETIEEFVINAKSVLCNNIYMNWCIGGKEYTNKEGYTAYDCFIPKVTNKKFGFAMDADAVITFNEADHIIKEKKKQAETVSSFEPETKSNDFDMF